MVSCEKIILGVLTAFAFLMCAMSISAFNDIKTEQIKAKELSNPIIFQKCLYSDFYLKYVANSYMLLATTFILITCVSLISCEGLYIDYAESIALGSLYFSFGPILLGVISYTLFKWEVFLYACDPNDLFHPVFSVKQVIVIGLILVASLIITAIGARAYVFKWISKILRHNSLIGRCCDRLAHKMF